MLRNLYLTKNIDKFAWYYRANYFETYFKFFPHKPQLYRKIQPASYKRSLEDIQNAVFSITILDRWQTPAPGNHSAGKKYIFPVCFPIFFFLILFGKLNGSYISREQLSLAKPYVEVTAHLFFCYLCYDVFSLADYKIKLKWTSLEHPTWFFP